MSESFGFLYYVVLIFGYLAILFGGISVLISLLYVTGTIIFPTHGRRFMIVGPLIGGIADIVAGCLILAFVSPDDDLINAMIMFLSVAQTLAGRFFRNWYLKKAETGADN